MNRFSRSRGSQNNANNFLWWTLVVIGAFAFFSFMYLFQGRVEHQPTEFYNDVRGLLQTEGFVVTNKKSEKMGVQLPTGMSVAGFSIAGVHEKDGHKTPYKFYVMPTVSRPPFMISVPDIQNEGVSRDIYDDGMFEAETHVIFEYIVNGPDGCSKKNKNGDPQLILDVGANLGWFTAYSSAAGCRAYGIEPQPRMITLINTTIEINEHNTRFRWMQNNPGEDPKSSKFVTMKDRVKIYNNIVNTDSQKLKIVYENGACWACSAVQPAGENDRGNTNEYIIPSIRLDQVIKEDVLLMKIDVESYEVRAIESAWSSLEKYNVKNILVEWVPRRWRNLHSVEHGTRILEQLYDLGYRIAHYELRMEYSKDGLTNHNVQGVGNVWEIPRNKLGDLNNHLNLHGYGEANLWLTKGDY